MPAARKRIGILGAFGTGNSGNEGTLTVMIGAARRLWPDADLVSICTQPDNVATDHGIPAIPLYAAPRGNAFRLISKVLFKVPSALADFMRARSHAADLDLLLIPGTGVLDDYNTGPMGGPYHIFKWCLAARVCRTPIALVSVGAGPIVHRLSRWFLRRAAAMAVYRSYRDEASREFMSDLGLDTTRDDVYPDLAFSLPVPDVGPDDEAKATIGLGVMTYHGWQGGPDGDKIYTDYVAKISRFAAGLLDQGFRIRLLMGDDVDLDAVKDVTSAIRIARPGAAPERIAFAPIRTLPELMDQIAGIEAIVASRFHNIVCALKLGRPAVSIGYSKKNDVLMEAMGLGAFCQRIEGMDVTLLERQFKTLMADRESYARQIEAVGSDFRWQLASQEAELARLLV
jgi:polysaccharide pyruvyl transferase WcaK-like protein